MRQKKEAKAKQNIQRKLQTKRKSQRQKFKIGGLHIGPTHHFRILQSIQKSHIPDPYRRPTSWNFIKTSNTSTPSSTLTPLRYVQAYRWKPESAVYAKVRNKKTKNMTISRTMNGMILQGYEGICISRFDRFNENINQVLLIFLEFRSILFLDLDIY